MQVNERYILEHFEEALEKGHIEAHYQPIYRALTGKICAVEALARWNDPELGMLSPMEFIGALEKHRLIYRLDLAILRRACACYRRLQGTDGPIHSFSVNFSRLDFEEPGLYDDVVAVLAEYQVPHEAIKIEITESVMLENWTRFRALLNAFRGAGFTVWVDDFGSGYSSLNVLQEFEFDLLKIDMLFLRSFSPRSMQLIATIVNMAKTLGIHTLAEGLETEEQLAFLKGVGCEIVQGFYYAKPLPEEALAAMLSPEAVESLEDKAYWNRAGRFNLLSPNPMESFQAEPRLTGESVYAQFKSEIPLALIECTWERVYYVYASEEYLKRIRALGFPDIDNLEHAFNDRINPRYGQLRSLILNAIDHETLQEMDYVADNVYYKFKVRCISKSKEKGKALIAAYLRTFDSEQELQQRNELMRYSQALYATYEHVNVLFPSKDYTERIFSRANFQTAHQLGTLRDGIRSFCEKEVYPEDQARYMRFFDFDSLEARVEASENSFIQQLFRINMGPGGYVWKAIRITKLPSVLENMYLYTMQSLPRTGVRIAETVAKAHPELLEEG